ncbi:putative quinol monooxygenase [Saccharibacillus qingshengii]|uniref:putative quinol monooxygenase n=1 Tax=Saccharibacillus qingshengii TaxID=1763540 RepID=UPI001554F385|nr:putative quinol monooxygenase [Saccharibacillus qingshengii]
MIIIHATFHINPAKEADFLNGITPVITASQAEEGNISYDLHKAVGQENVYTMVEVWTGQDAVALHNKSAHFTAFAATAAEYLTAPLNLKAFEGQVLS